MGILVAYLVKTDRRDQLPKVWLGVGIALVVISFALGAALLSAHGLTFEAQEAIGRHAVDHRRRLRHRMVFWMAEQARNIKGELETRVDSTAGGVGLVVLALLVVGREGWETALFTLGAPGHRRLPSPCCSGALLGLVVAVVLGVLVYRGPLRLDLRKFFTWTGDSWSSSPPASCPTGAMTGRRRRSCPACTTWRSTCRAPSRPARGNGTLLRARSTSNPRTTSAAARPLAALPGADHERWRSSSGSASPSQPVTSTGDATPPGTRLSHKVPDHQDTLYDSPPSDAACSPCRRSVSAPAGACTDNRRRRIRRRRGQGPTTRSGGHGHRFGVHAVGHAEASAISYSGDSTRVSDHRVLPAGRDGVDHRRGREHRTGLRRDRQQAEPGSYVTAQPGMTGDGYRGDFTVTDLARPTPPPAR